MVVVLTRAWGGKTFSIRNSHVTAIVADLASAADAAYASIHGIFKTKERNNARKKQHQSPTQSQPP